MEYIIIIILAVVIINILFQPKFEIIKTINESYISDSYKESLLLWYNANIFKGHKLRNYKIRKYIKIY